MSVPLEAPIVWSMGVHAEATRVVYELETDEGVAGVGESTYDPEALRLTAIASDALAGTDVLAVGALQRTLGTFGGSYETIMPPALRAGIEMASLDAAGKALGVPVSTLLGGAVRHDVAAAAYLFARQGRDCSPEGYLARAKELVERSGYRVLKVKGGVGPVAEDVRAVRLLAEQFPGACLRLDPNAAWRPGDALAVVDRLRSEGIALEYLEDPVGGLEAMAALRQRSVFPLATNMCVVAFEHLAPAIRAGAVDVVLADPHYWGGFRANLRMMAVCDAFGLGVGMHSDNDLGISTAAKLHLAAASPELGYAIDTHHEEHVDDLIVEPLTVADGSFTVPTGPGLGVELDREAVTRYERT